jgi:hypothetical protein
MQNSFFWILPVSPWMSSYFTRCLHICAWYCFLTWTLLHNQQSEITDYTVCKQKFLSRTSKNLSTVQYNTDGCLKEEWLDKYCINSGNNLQHFPSVHMVRLVTIVKLIKYLDYIRQGLHTICLQAPRCLQKCFQAHAKNLCKQLRKREGFQLMVMSYSLLYLGQN